MHLFCGQANLPVALGVTVAMALSGATVGVGCRQELPEPSSAVRVARSCGAPSAADYYFPRNIFAHPVDPSESATGPSRVFADMHEPSLSCSDNVSEAYRALWIHSFSTLQPAMVRLFRAGRSWSVVGARVKWPADDLKSPMTETDHREAVLSGEQGDEVVAILTGAGFWAIPTSVSSRDIHDGGLWLVEGRRGGAYHVVTRFGGKDQGFVTDVFRRLLNLAGIPIPKEWS